ncbi:hypothetical protein [Leeuwenhoekiella sp. W20_SRS_FM14]|uniref:hypothetical protein n=1 Tax=Leeuwenhoekiella sp. W20_SRS_FM14 TaxID=3240270 RepID=UPI003F982F1E
MEALEKKIENFISKYYKNELLKGFLFFIAIGLTYLLLVLAIEYWLWLGRWGRGFLFWSFVGIELLLIFRFILIPVFRLFKLSKGIDYTRASTLIGNHFPEVRDKLKNTLQLKSSANDSDLVQASILQKSKELEPIPFSLAINYKANAKYIKYALIPVLIFLAISFSKTSDFFGSSAKRVLNYSTEYIPPAPFNFIILNEEQTVIEGRNFEILAKVEGSEIPEELTININDVTYFMKNRGGGVFAYTVEQPSEDLNISFSGNGFSSGSYKFPLVHIPVISSFNMRLKYPGYLKMQNQIVSNTSSITVPEGTQVDWLLEANNTSQIDFISDTLINAFKFQDDIFKFSKTIFNSIEYKIATSNKQLKNYEELSYSIQVTKDAYPDLLLKSKKDTLGSNQTYYQGFVSDDNGLYDLKLVYYIENQSINKKSIPISIAKATVDQFYVSFPGKLNLEEGVTYNYYFEVRDNDAIHNYKATQSEIQNFQSLTRTQSINKQLESQQNSIQGLDKSIQKIEEQQKDLKELQDLQKEKNKLDFNDKRKLNSFLERQKEQEQMMKNYSEKLKNSLNELDKLNEKSSPENELLRKRIEKNEEQLKEQEKLLEELSKLQDLMKDEELKEKLDKMSKNSKNSSKSMQQLLELTKRFYVQTKGERLARQLQETGEEQIKEGQKAEEPLKENQEKLNKEFEEFKKSFEELKKENAALKQPLDIPDDKNLEKEIDNDQKGALEQMQKPASAESSKTTKEKQTSAGKKMKQLGSKLQDRFSSAGGGGAQQLEEDVEMLRQILDNLVVFSFDQEDLMYKFKAINNANPAFSKHLVKQNVLRDNFKYIDDSLFALSLRNPLLEEDINKELTNITFSLDQALDRLSDNNVNMGVVSERYVVSSSNTLADLLSNILDNMQGQLSLSLGQGSSGMPMPIPKPGGQGSGKQLSDIIMSQKELSEKLGEQPGQKGDGDKRKSGNGNDGKSDGEGDAKQAGSGEGSGSGGENGKSSNGGKGENENDARSVSEGELARQYEIYKQQEEIRNRLQDLINKEGLKSETTRILKTIEQVETDLLNGNSAQAKKRMSDVIQQFLKLEIAEQEQDKNTKREAEGTTKEFINSANSIIPESRNYFNTKELLNRDQLPLNGIYKNKVKEYFKQDND